MVCVNCHLYTKIFSTVIRWLAIRLKRNCCLFRKGLVDGVRGCRRICKDLDDLCCVLWGCKKFWRRVMSVITRIERFPLVVPPIVKLWVEGPALLLSEAPPSGRTFLEYGETAQTIKSCTFVRFTVCCANKFSLNVYMFRDGLRECATGLSPARLGFHKTPCSYARRRLRPSRSTLESARSDGRCLF